MTLVYTPVDVRSVDIGMNPVGQSRSGALPQVRVPDFRSPPAGGNSANKAPAATAAGAPGKAVPGAGDDIPRLRRISGATSAAQDAMMRYGSAAQIRNASVAGSQIDLYV